MSYFLSDKPLKTGEIVELSGEEARHILLSRRLQIGEMIEIQGPDEKRFEAEIIAIEKRTVSLQAIREINTPPESNLAITIFQSTIKEQPLDFVIQKATELGIYSLVIFNSQNSVDRFKEIDKKLARWRKISEEAAKQSGRLRGVKIEFLENIEEINDLGRNLDKLFLLEPTAKNSFHSIWRLDLQVNKIGILIGPEGGFTKEEVENFSKIKNVAPISMGPRILRSDTAAVTSSAIIQALWGDL